MGTVEISRMTRFVCSIVSVLFWVMIVATGLVVLAGLTGVNDPKPLGVDSSLPASLVRGLPEGLRARSVEAEVEIIDPTRAQYLLYISSLLFVAAWGLAVGWHLRKIALSVRHGDPFTADNVRRLRILAVLMLVTPVLTVAYTYVWNGILEGVAGWPGSGALDLNLSAIVSNLLPTFGFFVLGEIFQHGVRLREDFEATI
jgi:hypothetical protein